MNQQMIHNSMHTTGDCIETMCVRVCVWFVCYGVEPRTYTSHPTKFQTRGISAELMICGKAEASC